MSSSVIQRNGPRSTRWSFMSPRDGSSRRSRTAVCRLHRVAAAALPPTDGSEAVDLRTQGADIRQVAVALVVVQAVADDELVGHREALVADGDVHPDLLGLGQQGHDLQRCRPPRAQVLEQVLPVSYTHLRAHETD